MKLLLGGVCAMLLICFHAFGDSIDLVPVADTTISEQNQAHTTFNETNMIVGRLSEFGGQARCRALLRFDLTSLPANATITSARLTVFVMRGHTGNLDAHALHRLDLAWTESLATWDSTGTVPWSGGSFDQDPDSTAALGGENFIGTFESTTSMVATVQMWLTNTALNKGWALLNQDEETPMNGRRILSREASSDQPTFTIEYSVPPPPVRILSLDLSSSNVVMKSLGTNGNGWLAIPEYSSNLVVSNWTVVPQYSNSFTNGTNITVFDRVEPISGPNVFLRMKNVKN